MTDEDMRAEARRLAGLIMRLARNPAMLISHREGRYSIEDLVASAESDELVVRWEGEGQQLSGTDAAGPIPLGLEIANGYIGQTGGTFHHGPADFVDIATQIMHAMLHNERLAHDDLHIILGEDGGWSEVATMMRDASAAHPDLALRLAHCPEPHIELTITANGLHGVTGPSPALAAAVAALPLRAMLTWKRATSAQALAKRRDHGVPPMGRAQVRSANVLWKPHPGMPGTRGAEHIVRPAMPVTRSPAVPIAEDQRFDWTLRNWPDIQLFIDLKAEIQDALQTILVVNERSLIQQVELVRRKGKWAQRYPDRKAIPELSYEHADVLRHYNILQMKDGMLVAGHSFHELLRGLVATGYDSWAGISEIRRVERVPMGIEYEPQRYTYLGHDGRAVARLNKGGFTIESLHFKPETPTIARTGYAKKGLSPTDPLIAVVVVNGRAYPDFTRDIRSEIEGRLGVACDSSLDPRNLPGPLGALYRAPRADQVLIQRYLRWIRTQDQLPSFRSWRIEDDVEDYDGFD